MVVSTPLHLMFGDFSTEFHVKIYEQETKEPSNKTKNQNQSLSTDQNLANEEGEICSHMSDLKLVENSSDSEPAPSTRYDAGSPLSASTASSRPKSVLDDPLLKEELRKGSLQWDENKVLHYARMLVEEEIQSLQYSLDCDQDPFLAVKQFLSNGALVINSAFTKNGSVCLQKLIKRVKKTGYAHLLTQILATRFYDMMIHPNAKLVIIKCLEVFGPSPNLVLYEQAVNYLLPLARHDVGCFSLKVCIDTIRGDARVMLLGRIAQYSLSLSVDPHGNYIVQHVLGLRISSVNHLIMLYLSGQFVSLSQTKEGSHVTEKLMECYDCGRMAVVNEILDTPYAAYLLARHPFGNYVVQKALVMAKSNVIYMDIYMSLVEALRPHYRELSHTVGKHVINLIEDEFVGLNKQRRAY